MDIFHKQINTMKNNNLLLNKKIKILNTKTHLEGKKLDLNSKIKIIMKLRNTLTNIQL